MAMGMPHFHSENLTEFRIWCTMVYQQGFVLVYTTRANMLVLGRAKALETLCTLIRVAYTGKPMLLGDMDRDDHTMMTMHTK